MDPERLKQIQDLINKGKSRQEVAGLLGVSISTVDRARVGMDKLPRGGRRDRSGRPATGARPLLRKAVDSDLLEWLDEKQDPEYLNRLLRVEKQFEQCKGPIAEQLAPMVVIGKEDGQHKSLNCRVVEWVREDRAGFDTSSYRMQVNLLVREADQLQSWLDFLGGN